MKFHVFEVIEPAKFHVFEVIGYANIHVFEEKKPVFVIFLLVIRLLLIFMEGNIDLAKFWRISRLYLAWQRRETIKKPSRLSPPRKGRDGSLIDRR